MQISLIITFYKGQQYLDHLVDIVLANKKNLEASGGHKLNCVIINDSPDVNLNAPARSPIQVITNPTNLGIHGARVTGLMSDSVKDSEYIMFLDQDDDLSDDAITSLVDAAINNNYPDIVIANANLEQADKSLLPWYRTDYHKKLIWDLTTYVDIGIQIMSPGQCLIKKASIPEFWTDEAHWMKINGADDYFLFMLMMSAGCKHAYLDKIIYTHKYTGENISGDQSHIDESIYEFMDFMFDWPNISHKDLFVLHDMIWYKSQWRSRGLFGKIIASTFHIGCFVKNIKYKFNTKTPLGFNRN